MKTGLLVGCIVSATLLLSGHVAAAGQALTFTADLDIVGGGGQLENGSTFSVSGLSFVADTANRHFSVQNGSLVLDGVTTECTIESVVPDCSQTTLLCEDVTYAVTPTVEGGSPGSLGEFAVATGSIRLVCKHWPASPR